jgi:hypothetical protein
MCNRSVQELVDIDTINCKYSEDKLNKEYALTESWRFIDIPIIVDKDYNIVDGNHRYLLFKEHGYKKINVRKLDLTFAQTKKWRDADNCIKDFCTLTGNNLLSYEFKKLSNII